MSKALRVLLLAALVPSPVFAIDAKQPTSARSIEATSVVIPFQPPLGRTLVYGLSDPSFRGEALLTLRFERSGNAYAMRSTVEAANIEDGNLFKMLHAHPIVLNVSGEGKVTGMVDEAAYWSRVSTAFEAYKRTSTARKTVSKMLDWIRSESAEQRAHFASKHQRLVLDGVGTHHAMSRPSMPTSFGIISQSIMLDDAKATIVSRGEGGPEAMQRLFTDVLSLGAPYDGPRKVQASFRIEMKRVIDRRTGLVIDHEAITDRQVSGRASRSQTRLVLKAAK